MDFFKGRKGALATMHGKEKVISPIFKKELGIDLIVPDNFNTDKFGTFTMDKKRKGNQLEAARFKALAAMEVTGLDIGVASEGSFSQDTYIPFLNSNLELIIMIDKKNNLEIIGYSKSLKTNASGKYVHNIHEALSFSESVGFPSHGVILRKRNNSETLFKGIVDKQELETKFNFLIGGFFNKKVYIETDLRAHMNPTRMENIEKAALNIVENIKSICLRCGTPGFCVDDYIFGMECLNCGMPTNYIKFYIKKCKRCGYKQEIPSEVNNEDIDSCSYCNP